MIRDLTMDNVVIRCRGGGVPSSQVMDSELLEKIWRACMLRVLIRSNAQEFEKSGVGRSYFEERLSELFNESEGDEEDGGVVELEVFKHKKAGIN